MGIDPSEAEDHVCEPGAPAWMATFGDLMSLLLVFFVLMLTFANMDKQLFLKAMGSIRHALGTVETRAAQFEVLSTSPLDFSEKKSTPFLDILNLPTAIKAPSMDQKILQQLQMSIAENNLENMIETESSERGIHVRVKGKAIFAPGSDLLLPESYIFLDEIVRLTEEFPYALSIEGHTDDRPIGSGKFPSNWHLSALRAIAVLQYFVDVGGISPAKLSAAGFAHTRPLYDNDSAENRAANRRVEFVYLRDPGVTRAVRAKSRRAAEASASPAASAGSPPVESSGAAGRSR